jgi:hypothetical protein
MLGKITFHHEHKRYRGPLPALTSAFIGEAIMAIVANIVQGRIFFEHGLPASGITVRAYNLGFGGVDVKVGEVTTDDQGQYVVNYNTAAGTPINLELRTVDAQGKEITLSDVRYGAATQEVVNLVAPTTLRPLDAEYQRLSADITKQIGSIDKLKSAQETEDRQDLTLLNSTTGWDARLTALAAKASAISLDTGLSTDVLYGMFRAGLPTDKTELARLSSDAVGMALNAARGAGIVAFTDAQVAGMQTRFQKFAVATLQASKASGTVSSFAELLGSSGLTDSNKQATFAQLYFAGAKTPVDLWQQAKANNFTPAEIDGLKLHGMMCYATCNNARLAGALRQEIGSTSNLTKLVDNDLHQPDGWKARLTALANNNDQQLAAMIPPGYGGDKTADRLDAYAADLARRVRVSFPTRVVGRMLQKGDLKFPPQQETPGAAVGMFLMNATPLGFALGRTLVDAFVKENPTVFAGISSADQAATVAGVKQASRLYQTTPSPESLKAALDLGFTSAHDIARLPHDKFIERYGSKFPSLHEAELVHRKAQQITTVVFNAFSAAKHVDSSPPIFGLSPPPTLREAAKQALIKQYPTMESLFGSLDFCECEECGSVLSPAAYLVDLLQFLDHKPADWQIFLADWKKTHNNIAYPFHNQAQLNDWIAKHPGQTPPLEKTPYQVLVQRRPDLPNLPLTCENTNTELPYIDVVNEILEYFVVHNALAANSAYDTGDATSAELIAEPQNVLSAAYDNLKQAKYPLTLPFDLSLETVRHFLKHFDIQFSEVLEAFRPSDELFAPPTNPKAYYRNDIFIASLGLSPSEYALFTDPAAHTAWFSLYGYADANTAASSLSSAKTLSRKLDVAYRELADLVSTGFINPALQSLAPLHKLGASIEDVFRYEKAPNHPALSADEQAAFDGKLSDLTKLVQSPSFDAKTWLDKTWQSRAFDQVLVLADPDTGCDFDKTILRYANGTAADAIVFLKINLFVRLWRKLGWTMEEVDRALQMTLPKNLLPLTTANVGTALRTALIYLSHLKSLDRQFAVGSNSRLKLSTLWANLPTTGKNPLYARLFLTRSVVAIDPIFDDPLGNYLSQGFLLKDHLLAVQAALNLTADEIASILADAGQTLAATKLSLDTVSLLYRYGLLAKALSLPVRDLVSLKALSGLDPFKPLAAAPATKLADDYPFTQTLRFVEIARLVAGSGFRVADLDYLLRHQLDDPSGKYKQDANALLRLVKTLAAGLRQIEAAYAMPSDAAALATFTDAMIQEKLALVLPTDAVATVMGMWTGSVQYEAAQPNVPSANQLDPKSFADVPAIRVRYDDAAQTQRLTYQGVLTDTQRTQLQAAHSSPVLAALLANVTAQQKAFYDKYFAAFLSPADYATAFAPAPLQPSDAVKRQTLLAGLLPYVRRQLTLQFVVQALAATLGADPGLIQTLITNSTLLADPTAAGAPLLEALASSQKGIDVGFFTSADSSGPALAGSKTPISGRADSKGLDRPAGTNSIRFEGYFEVPSPGPYTFFVQLDKAGARAQLRLNDLLPDPIIPAVPGADTAATDAAELTSQPVDLKAGVPYRFTFDVGNLAGGDARLLIIGQTLPRDAISQLTLYAKSSVARVGAASVLLAKTLQYIETIPLNERELRYLASHAADFDGLSFSRLPTRAADPSAAAPTLLFQQFLRLAVYAQLKNDIAGGGDDPIGIFENARRTYPTSTAAAQAAKAMTDDLCGRVADLARRDLAAVRAAATQLGMTPNAAVSGTVLTVQAVAFSQERGLRRLWTVLQLAQKLGVPVDALARWAVPAPDFSIAHDLRSTVKAQYSPENWLAVAPTIFDKLRQVQRDALVSYIVNQQGFENKNQLFEYFLVDPGMEPVVRTSRLRLAISIVQSFVLRCLLNLEPEVQPSALDADLWQWMKQYRVWQANREIFLFPENWLEPEFRDDKTELYQDLESALLQGDVTNDLAEDAYFKYLRKLEEIARLEIVTIFCETNALEPDLNTLHVIGRTHGSPHSYLYRRYVEGMWTPWESVGPSIDGDHVVAVMWHGRLNLFWLKFLQQVSQDSGRTSHHFELPMDIDVPQPPHRVQVQLNWTQYFQGQWTPPISTEFQSPMLKGSPIPLIVASSFEASSVFVYGSTDVENDIETARVHLHFENAFIPSFRVGPFWTISSWAPLDLRFDVTSRNSPPQLFWGGDPPPDALYGGQRATTHNYGSNPLQVTYADKVQTVDGQAPSAPENTFPILGADGQGAGSSFAMTLCGMPVDIGDPAVAPLVSPFFYQDSRNAFYVEPTLTETTIDQWDYWAIPHPPSRPWFSDPQWWKDQVLVASAPAVPIFEGKFDAGARFQIRTANDWVTGANTVLQFGDRVVGRTGSLNLSVVDSGSVRSLQPVAVMTGAVSSMVNGGTPIFHVISDSGIGPRPITATNAHLARTNTISFGR